MNIFIHSFVFVVFSAAKICISDSEFLDKLFYHFVF